MLPATLALISTLLGAELGTRQAGSVKLRFVASDTAQVFRIVDQLSGWSASGPERFAPVLPAKLKADEKKLLERHAEVRNRVGWQVTHTAFIVESSLDEACALAVSKKLLGTRDASTECEVLRAFAPRVRDWVKARAAQLEATVAALTAAESELVRFAREAARFSQSKLDGVDIYLVPSLDGADGAYTAGRIVLEAPPRPSDDPLLHELWHAFAGPHLAAYQRAVEGRPRLSVDTLSEGIAYAVQPGLFTPPTASGALELSVGAAMRSGEPSSLMGSTRPLELAIALRPSLGAAWANGTLDAYLPTAVAIYEAISELDKAALATPRGLLIFGDTIAPRLPITSTVRRLDPELLKYPLTGQAVGFALAGRGPEAIPKAFRERFLPSWEEIESKASADAGSIELTDTSPPVFVWWDRGADAKEQLSLRVRESMFRFVAKGFAKASGAAVSPDAGTLP